MQEYSNEIAVFPSGKYLLVNPIYINPCTYSVVTLHYCELRDTDLTKAFGGMFLEKTTEKAKGYITQAMTPEELLSRIDTVPLPMIYNATYFSIYQSASTNQY